MIGGKVMNFIEELYYGNINPNEKRYDKDAHYTKTMRKFCDSENELGKMLKGKPLHLVNDLKKKNEPLRIYCPWRLSFFTIISLQNKMQHLPVSIIYTLKNINQTNKYCILL
jgi:hypothetical protein